jgi:hypothetical protein
MPREPRTPNLFAVGTRRQSMEDRMRMGLGGLKSRQAGLAALVAGSPLLLSACNQVGTQSLTFWDIVWSMIVFYFIFMLIWIWITCLADIFRRNDLSGAWKAIWIVALIFLPLLGALVYMISRPKATAQDVQMMARQDAAVQAASQVSTADELAKLAELKAAGTITEPEYNALKAKLLG